MFSKGVKPKLFQLQIKKIISTFQCDNYSDLDGFRMPQLRCKMRLEIRFVHARLLQLILCSHYFSDLDGGLNETYSVYETSDTEDHP